MYAPVCAVCEWFLVGRLPSSLTKAPIHAANHVDVDNLRDTGHSTKPTPPAAKAEKRLPATFCLGPHRAQYRPPRLMRAYDLRPAITMPAVTIAAEMKRQTPKPSFSTNVENIAAKSTLVSRKADTMASGATVNAQTMIQ